MAATKIDMLIRQLCRETGEPDYRNYDTILSHVRGALVDLNLFVFPNLKTVELTANNLKNLHWPSDCIKPVLVGLRRKNKICNISVDSGISPSIKNDVCGCITDIEDDINNILTDECEEHYRYDGGLLIGYGYGYDHLKACTHNYQYRLSNIKFKIWPNDTFQFTYISDGIGEGVSHVPVEAETAIREWVFWNYYRVSRPGISATARQNYKEESYRLGRFYKDQTLEDWVKAVVKP